MSGSFDGDSFRPVVPGTGNVTPTTGKEQIVARRCHLPNAQRQGTAGSRTDVQHQDRKTFITGPSPVKDLRIGFTGYSVSISNAGELPLPNDYTIEAAIEAPAIAAQGSGAFYELAYFAAQRIANVPAGHPGVFSDGLFGIDFPANQTFFVRSSMTITADTGYFFYSPDGALMPTDGYTASPTVTSQVAGTGQLTAAAAGSGAMLQTSAAVYATCAVILGTPQTPHPAVVIVGDSIANGTGELPNVNVDGFASSGFLQRGIAPSWPYLAETISGNCFSYETMDKSPRKRSLWKYATHHVCELGTNDIIQNAATLSQLQAYATAMWVAAKRTIGPYGKPLKTAQTTLAPRLSGQSGVQLFNLSLGSGGTGYAASSTFDVTVAGGTVFSGSSATLINVTTNSSGVITTINGFTNNGVYVGTALPTGITYADGQTQNTISPTGGAGSGLTIKCYAGYAFDIAHQVVALTAGGVRYQYNAWLKSQVGVVNPTYGIVLLDAVIDSGSTVEDPNNPGYWLTNGTPGYLTVDGTHPCPAGHVLMSAPVSAWASALTV